MKYVQPTTKMSGQPSFLSDSPDDEHLIKVTSRLLSWYYVSFKAYRVVRQSTLPHPGLFGGIAYRRIWLLRKPGA